MAGPSALCLPPRCSSSLAAQQQLGAPSRPQQLWLPPGSHRQQLLCRRRSPLPPLLPSGRRQPAAAAAAAAAAGADGDRPQVQADSIIEPDGTVRLQPQTEEDRRDLWRRAIKLPMYSVGWAPILVCVLQDCCRMLSWAGRAAWVQGPAMCLQRYPSPRAAVQQPVAHPPRPRPPPLPAAPQVSAAAAYVQTGAFDPVRTLLLCVAATAIIGWLNLRCGGCGPGPAAGCAASSSGMPASTLHEPC